MLYLKLKIQKHWFFFYRIFVSQTSSLGYVRVFITFKVYAQSYVFRNLILFFRKFAESKQKGFMQKPVKATFSRIDLYMKLYSW